MASRPIVSDSSEMAIREAQRDCWRYLDTELPLLRRLRAEVLAELRHDVSEDPYIGILEVQVAGIDSEIQRRARIAAGEPTGTLLPKVTDDKSLIDLVDEIKRRLPINEALERLWSAKLIKVGSSKRLRWKCQCILPGHADKHPSMTVYGDGRAWCFTCNAGGDVIDLTMSYFGLGTFRQAVERLAQEVGITHEDYSPRRISLKGTGNREQSKVCIHPAPFKPFTVSAGRVAR